MFRSGGLDRQLKIVTFENGAGRNWECDGNPHGLRLDAFADYIADLNLATCDHSYDKKTTVENSAGRYWASHGNPHGLRHDAFADDIEDHSLATCAHWSSKFGIEVPLAVSVR